MRLTLREAATALNCTEKTVLRWIAQAGLPTVRLGGLYHFNRAELMEWAIHHGIGSTALSCELEPEEPDAEDGDCATVSALAAALRMGGVLTDVPGRTLPEILAAAVTRLLPHGPESQRQLVLDMLLAREETGVTAVGGGVLVPHVRAPLILGDLPRILLVYPREPLPLSALAAPDTAPGTTPGNAPGNAPGNSPDNAPIEAVFVLAAPTVRAHLTLLALLAAALRDADFRAAVLCRAPEAALRMSAAAAERMHESARKRRSAYAEGRQT